MSDPHGTLTFLFTDIEGSTRLWEESPDRMRPALARHDALARAAVSEHRGHVVKMLGDGVHAAFADPLDAIAATLALQRALSAPEGEAGIVLNVRCGLHAGEGEHRDGDYYGSDVNRAARVASVAHGGQVLVSQAVAALVADRLPEGVALRDLGAVRLRDLASAERVFQVLSPALRQDFPALRSLERTPNNLPQQATSFVGRARELAEVRRMLAQARLVTLVGAGGIGKSRLSLHVAAELLDDFPDGIWFVELAALTDGELVAQAVATAVGVKEDAGRPVAEALVRFVRDRRLLLIVDNCEHVLRACAVLVKQLLDAGSRLRVLASSREYLRIVGEAAYPVPALGIPVASPTVTPASLGAFESVRLFVDRAVAMQPGFRLTTDNAVAVADICQRLDGIPLALELAAARVRAMPVQAIAARLGDRFRLLASGNLTALPRQQTLRALIDWSHDLLDDSEQRLFRRLAAFAGGWTLEAAEAVTAGDDTHAVQATRADGPATALTRGRELASADVLDVLCHLVEKSLVALDPGSGRYRFLDTVRAYAGEKLQASGEGERLRSRHLACFAELSEQATPEFDGPNQTAWLLRFDAELENLLAAHAAAGEVFDGAAAGLRLASAVKPYWFIRGMLGLGHRITVEALAREGARARDMPRCRALFDAGQICCFMGRYDEALAYLGESLAIAKEIGDARRVAMALQPLSMASLGRGDLEAARRYSEEAVVAAQALGDGRQLAGALNALAQFHRTEGELDAAEPLYERVVALARDLGDRESVAIGLLNLAMVSIGRGARERARRILQEIVDIAHAIGSRPVGQSVLDVTAGLAAVRGDSVQAARLYGAAEAQADETGMRRDAADDAFLAPLVAQARAALDAAAFTSAEAGGRALTYDGAMTDARRWLADAGDDDQLRM